MDDDETNPECRWLYHYTTSSGLIGIVANRSIWATDARFLNDAQELQYGRQALCEALHNEIHPLRSDPEYPFEPDMKAQARVYGDLAELLEPRDGTQPQTGAHTAYVASFSAQRRRLSQWRAYGTDGYCLRFERELLTKSLPDLSEFAQIAYGPAAISPMAVLAMKEFRRLTDKTHPLFPALSRFGLTAETLYYPEALAALATVKHEAFVEEDEWRLVVVGRPGNAADEKFRSGPLGLTPYIDVTFPVDALTAVDVAPGPNQNLRTIAARMLLDSMSMNHVHVRADLAPLR